MDDRIAAAVEEQVRDGTLSCAAAFRVAETQDVAPLVVGETADDLNVRLVRCQMGLFGYGERNRIVEPAAEVSAELEQAIRDGLVEGRLPCATAWRIARQFHMPKLGVASAAEKLEIRIKPCQLGAF